MMSIAMDATARTYDADGRLHVNNSHISKATVNPYYGKEIPMREALNLDPDKIYYLLRDPAELEKAASTFERLPILSEHIPFDIDSPKPELVIGSIGSNVSFDGTYLNADLSFWDKTAIAGIETDKVRELSCAYRYIPVMESGEYNGLPYDGRMTDIKGNHLALVEVGRAGSDVIVSDSNPFINPEDAMKKAKLKAALEAKFAQDADIDSARIDSIIDAVLGVEEEAENNPEAVEPLAKQPAMDEDEDDKEEDKAVAKDADEESDDVVKKEDMVKAMDSMRQEFKDLSQAERDVRSTVGDVHGMDSAAAVYKFALDHLTVDHSGIDDIKALKALYVVATKQSKAVSMAQDAAQAKKPAPFDRIVSR